LLYTLFYLIVLLVNSFCMCAYFAVAMANGGPIGILTTLVATAIILPFFLPLSVLLHELGHVIAARAVKFEFQEFVVGWVRVTRTEKSWHVRLAALPRPYWGFVRAFPRSPRQVRIRMVAFVLGGPAMNILVGILFLIAGFIDHRLPMPVLFDFVREMRQSIPDVLTSMWTLIGILSLGFGAVNLLPALIKRGYPNDGYILRNWIRKDPEITRYLELLDRNQVMTSLMDAMRQGFRPREWEPNALDRFAAVSDGTSNDVAADLYSYYYLLDTGQIERAGKSLDMALAAHNRYPLEYRPNVTLEGAYFEAFFRHNLDRAREWLAESTGGNSEEHTRLRAQAAVLLQEGKINDAIVAVDQALTVTSKSNDPGGTKAEIDLLHAIRDECERRLATRASK
jgi:hypothetical protein